MWKFGLSSRSYKGHVIYPSEKTQNSTVKATSAILQALTALDSLEVKDKNLKTSVARKCWTVCYSVQLISMRHRDLQRPYISKAYCILTSPTVPKTTNLYGDNISKTISSITEFNKLVRRISFPQAFHNRPKQHFHDRSQPF